GEDTFSFKASDGSLESNAATATVTINALPAPGNIAPIANDLTLVAYEGGAINGTLPAADANGDSLNFSIVANGAKGRAVITNATTGAFTYTPNAGASGDDTFTFKVSDGLENSNTATVTITIQPANGVVVTGHRSGGGGGFDLTMLILGATLAVMKRCRGIGRSRRGWPRSLQNVPLP
ncbi:MAG: Ig-like domain-containing protein, partial [Steroidobacteraceae bacterium]|nr:Ig-like domain-containing protein [Steroidobacteraceae bacterium]